MADQFDQAQRIDQLMTDSARAHQEKKALAEPKLKPKGECYNPCCGEPLSKKQLFCGPHCAKQHSIYKK